MKRIHNSYTLLSKGWKIAVCFFMVFSLLYPQNYLTYAEDEDTYEVYEENLENEPSESPDPSSGIPFNSACRRAHPYRGVQ